MTYQVQLGCGAIESVEGADGYIQEGPLTTFFAGHDGRPILDSWARRLASYRTADLTRIRWLGDATHGVTPRPPLTMTLKAS